MANSATTTTSAGAERRKANGKVPDGEITLNGAAGAAAAQQTEKESDQKEDFFWTYTEEPHRTRRLAIIKAHPEVRSSFFFYHGMELQKRSKAPGQAPIPY